jgi:hypothetical protein
MVAIHRDGMKIYRVHPKNTAKRTTTCNDRSEYPKSGKQKARRRE